MPTVDIPDKICPHCGGTRWIEYFIVKKSAKTGVIKTYTGRKCAKKNIEFGNKWRKNNIEHHRKVVRERIQNKRKTCVDFANKERERKRKYHQKYKEERKLYRKNWAILNPQKDLDYSKKNMKNQVNNLTDYYVSRTIIGRNCILKKNDIPQELIEMKRNQLLLTKKIKNNDKEEQHSN
jgi:hypothetical protein